MKKSNLGLALIGLAIQVLPFAYAHATPKLNGAAPFEINIPSLAPGFEFSGTGYWLQPTASNVYYSVLTTPLPIPSPSWRNKAIDHKHSWSYGLVARYIFPCSGNDIRLSWDYLNTTDSNTTVASNTQFVAPIYEVGPPGGQIRAISGRIKFNYDVINLDAGQFVNIGCRHIQLRLFGGLSGVYIKQEFNNVYRDNGPTFVVHEENDSKYTGVGPRFGVDTTYYLGCGFGVVGHIAGSLYVGKLESDTHFTSVSNALAALGIPVNHQRISADDTTQVVPSLDAKLGLNYAYQLCNTTLTVEAGYFVASYINAINQFHPSSVVTAIELGTVAVATMGQTHSNFGVNGPYITFSVKI